MNDKLIEIPGRDVIRVESVVRVSLRHQYDMLPALVIVCRDGYKIEWVFDPAEVEMLQKRYEQIVDKCFPDRKPCLKIEGLDDVRVATSLEDEGYRSG